MTTQSKFLYHTSCDDCGSRDNKGVYDDGHTFCFGCHIYRKADGTEVDKTEKTEFQMIQGKIEALPKRRIDIDTCRKFNYQTGEYKGKPVHIANYYD